MATNNIAPTGLAFSRNYLNGANTYSTSQMLVKNGTTAAIGMGDLVIFGASTFLGYVIIAPFTANGAAAPGYLGVFNGVLPYYDTTLQATAHGLNGAYLPTAAPPVGADIPCTVITDPFATFVAQMTGAAAVNGFLQAWVGNNVNFLTGTNGVPGANGRSVLQLDASTILTNATLPFRIIGPAGVVGGPQDPTNANPWVEVRLNNSNAISTVGV